MLSISEIVAKTEAMFGTVNSNAQIEQRHL